MSPRQRESKPTASTAPREERRGVEGHKSKSRASDGRTAPLVKSVLIEPRHNEPPRVSVSIEYSETAPSVLALKKATMETIHGVVKQQPTLVDLGYRAQQRSRLLTQTFEAREESK